MSMISSQCDELRELALWLDDEFYDVEAAKVRDAADLILELRDNLQCANAENSKLREENVRLWADGVHWELSRCPGCENVAALQLAQDDNEKLREFASEAFSMAFNFYHGAGTAEDLRELKVKYCELGIEAKE